MKQIKSSPALGGLLVLLAACLWGCTGLFVGSISSAGLQSMEIVVLRGIITSVVMMPLMLAIDPGMFRIRLRDLWCFIGSGVLSVLFFNYCYYSNIQETSPAVAVVMLFTAPVFVTLLSIPMFKEKLTWRKVIAVVLILAGCALVSGIVGEGANLTRRGIVLGICSGFGYGLYSIFSRLALNRGYSPTTITFYTFLLSAIGGVFLVDFGHIAAASAAHGMQLWGPLVAYVLIGTVGAYLMYTAGLSYMDTSKAAVMQSAEPAAATVLQIVVLGIWPDTLTLVGVGLVTAAIAVLNWPGGKKR